MTAIRLTVILFAFQSNMLLAPSRTAYKKLNSYLPRLYFSSKTATIPTTEYKLHKLEEGPAKSGELTAEDAKHWLREMCIMRRMETTCAGLYKEKKIRGFCHLYAGEEAIAAGVFCLINKEDSFITAYRCHAWAYLFGASAYSIIAELLGRESGCVRGKGGSMHVYAKRFYGGNGIVGAQVPLGTGIALSIKYKKQDAVMYVLYGDGAANQGQVFEAFNIAKLWKLPIIYICENNLYAMGTSNVRSAASTDYYKRGDYIPGIYVDGLDLITVREATRYAIKYVKSGNGPIIMEMNTYRFYGHSMSDPGTSYRTQDEVQQARKTKDPITKFKKVIVDNGLLTDEEVKSIETAAKKTVDDDGIKATSDKEINIDELTYDVYKNHLQPDIRGLHEWTRLPHKNIGTPF